METQNTEMGDQVMCPETQPQKSESVTEPETLGTQVQHPSRSHSPTGTDTHLCYQTQLFGFTSMSFSDEIHNALLQYSWDALEQAQLIIKKEFPTKVASEDVDNTTKNITTKMIKCFQDAFDKLEMYLMAQIFHIQKHVVLPEDAIQEQFPNAPESLLEVDTEIEELKTKIREAKVTNACLKQELVDIRFIQVQLDKTLTYVNDVLKVMSPEQCETLSFVCSKALQLKQLVEGIEHKLLAEKPHIDVPPEMEPPLHKDLVMEFT